MDTEPLHPANSPREARTVGDINRDGLLNKDDLALLRQLLDNPDLYLALTRDQQARLDINQDGALSYNDVARLIELMATSLPVDRPGESREAMEDSLNALRNRLRER